MALGGIVYLEQRTAPLGEMKEATVQGQHGTGWCIVVFMSMVENKRVGFDYEILETLEAGLELFGFEVKSLRAGDRPPEGAHRGATGGGNTTDAS